MVYRWKHPEANHCSMICCSLNQLIVDIIWILSPGLSCSAFEHCSAINITYAII